ncbi:uncharacterized protein LOC127261364 isoform X2 [Andrographis paniculata]|uniref:uncharacterized protein LOC127261364 isoform X2 n=1 Tax=Andrographis paniculata TaxID=175694 RepID=UPI0021E8C27A|nr:uncharacterized protein LOC127261364 isoform X2 [Andrographis paniculata]
MKSDLPLKDQDDVKSTNLGFPTSKIVVSQNGAAETPVPDSGSVSVSSNGNGKVSREDIEFVQNLIERCLQLYMNKDEIVENLQSRVGIDRGFTKLVWQKLEEENADFFRAYYTRLKLKKQIVIFNHLLEHQSRVMTHPVVPPKAPLAAMQKGVRTQAANSLPIGYPIMHQPPIPYTGQPCIDPMVYTAPSCHMVDGASALRNFHLMRLNTGNDGASTFTMGMAEISPSTTLSPSSAASSGHFGFSSSEAARIEADTCALDAAFMPDVASSAQLHLPPDNGPGNSQDSPRSLSQIPWNFSFTDLTVDMSNLAEFGALGSYPGSPFLASDSDLRLNSLEHETIVEEFFVDSDHIPKEEATANNLRSQ